MLLLRVRACSGFCSTEETIYQGVVEKRCPKAPWVNPRLPLTTSLSDLLCSEGRQQSWGVGGRSSVLPLLRVRVWSGFWSVEETIYQGRIKSNCLHWHESWLQCCHGDQRKPLCTVGKVTLKAWLRKHLSASKRLELVCTAPGKAEHKALLHSA